MILSGCTCKSVYSLGLFPKMCFMYLIWVVKASLCCFTGNAAQHPSISIFECHHPPYCSSFLSNFSFLFSFFQTTIWPFFFFSWVFSFCFPGCFSFIPYTLLFFLTFLLWPEELWVSLPYMVLCPHMVILSYYFWSKYILDDPKASEVSPNGMSGPVWWV